MVHSAVIDPLLASAIPVPTLLDRMFPVSPSASLFRACFCPAA
jgi:hypothetical protein